MSRSTFLTPLRYPGGKGKLGPWLGELMRHNRISGGWYVEPYAGGSGAAIYLLISGYVDHIVINDIDPAVYCFWWAVLNDTQAFLELLEKTDVTMKEWEKQKKVHAEIDKYSPTEIGFATFFLNRTNRSGILKGGVIGGKNQTGNYKIDARFNKKDLLHRISRIAMYKGRISLYNLDAIKLIDQLSETLPRKVLIYLDPPYYNKGSQLYRNHYVHHDHEEIFNCISSVDLPWLVTYDNCGQIKEIYEGKSSTEFSLRYSTHISREKATELMFYDNLELHEGPKLTR